MKASGKKCPMCTRRLVFVHGALTCPDCGYVERTEGAGSYEPDADIPASPEKKGSSNGWVIALVAGIVVAVLAVGGVFLVTARKVIRSMDSIDFSRTNSGVAGSEDKGKDTGRGTDRDKGTGKDRGSGQAAEALRPQSEFLTFLLECVYDKPVDEVTQQEIEDIIYLEVYRMEHTDALSFNVLLADGTDVGYITETARIDTKDFKCLKGLRYLKLDTGSVDYGTDWHGLKDLQYLACKASPADIAGYMDPSQLISLSVDSTFGMNDLQGMQIYDNLEYLTVDADGLSAITGVSEMPALRGLYLEDADRIKDYSELYKMPQLEELAIESKGLRDIGFISGMDGLIYLELTGTDLKNIDAVADCADTLIYLYLDRNYRIEDYSAVLQCTGLEELELYVDYNFDVPMEVPDLSAMKDLRLLHLGNFDRFSNLGKLTWLESLTVEGPSFGGSDTLADLTNLKSLSLLNTSVFEGSFDCLPNLTDLQYLDLKDSFVWCDISPVFALPNLKWLDLERVECGLDMHNMQVSENLTYLNLTKTKFDTLHEDGSWDYQGSSRIMLGDVPELFACFPNLRILYVPGHELESLEFARPLSRLYILDISDNYITDTAPIRELGDTLALLMCEGTPLTDLSAFEDVIIVR